MDGEAAYYMYNGHGDVTALLDAVGSIKATYYYDAFGNATEQTGTVKNPYRYAGYRFDDETGLYYLNARYYDSSIARFMTEDTYRGEANDPLSLNLYTYCMNNPIAYDDPTGHSWADSGPDDKPGLKSTLGKAKIKAKAIANTAKKQVVQKVVIQVKQKVVQIKEKVTQSATKTAVKTEKSTDDMASKAKQTKDNNGGGKGNDTDKGTGGTVFDKIDKGMGDFFTTKGKNFADSMVNTLDKAVKTGTIDINIPKVTIDDIYNTLDSAFTKFGNAMENGDTDALIDMGTKAAGEVIWNGGFALATPGGIKGGTLSTIEEASTARVGRWMAQSEYDAMVDTGKVMESYTGTTHVASPADINSFGKQAKPGSLYVEFDVPDSSLKPTNEGWAKIVGPNSLEGRLAKKKGLPVPEMPNATNIEVKGRK